MAKINLLHVKGHSFFCEGIFSIGVYVKGKVAVLIDSGISKEGAKEVHKALVEKDLQVGAIINTHCHGDHCGGNAFFQQKYPDLRIFSTEVERPFIEDPLLAPICFCGGAAAFEALNKCKPITPQQGSKITDLIAPYADQMLTICGEVFQIITLPGHTRGMIAVKTPDNVLYCGDAIFGEPTFSKHPILFYTFIHDTLHSFKKLKHLIPSVEHTIIYHGGLLADPVSLIEAHEKRILETKDLILELLQIPLSVEELTAKVMRKHAISDDLISYTLTKTPIQAYLADLERENKIQIRVIEGVARAYLTTGDIVF